MGARASIPRGGIRGGIVTLVSSWRVDDLIGLEETTQTRSFALDPAWAEAAQESGYAEPRWMGLERAGSVRAVTLGLIRRRGGFSKAVCGSNGGVGILAVNSAEGAELLRAVRRQWRPSVLEAFASSPIPDTAVSWEASHTIHIELRPPIEEIQAKFDKRNRSGFRKAVREGVKAECVSSSSALDKALQLVEVTASVKGFRLPPREYLRSIHSAYRRNGLSEIVIARRGPELLAVVHVIGARGVASWWKGGASSPGYRLNAPLVAHWRAIEIAKERGFKTYDLGGTHPSDPAYEGIHRFKSSFGGKLITTYVGRRTTTLARGVLSLRSL
jgi:Acetyltransferase (GNAT) domain